MTPLELFEYDVNGYLLLEDAIDSSLFDEINARMDQIQEAAVSEHDSAWFGENPVLRIDGIVNQEPALIPLVDNPIVLPYIKEMVDHPRLKSTWITYKWRGGGTGFHSNHVPTVTHNFYHYNGEIRHNLFQVFYAMKDIGPGEGALQVIPGSHKANYRIPRGENVDHLKIEIPMKAGSVLLFSHDMYHGSLNTSDTVRRTVIFTYCPGVIANSYTGDTLYDSLFDESSEGSWRKYLLRRPNGFKETYPMPAD